MEQNQNSSLFELGLTGDAKSHLTETAKWAKFLAICGMIAIVLMIIIGVVVSIGLSSASSQFGNDMYGQSGMAAGLGMGVMVFYIIVGLLYFFPCLFLLQFGNKMKLAIASGDDLLLSESFRNLKKTFRYLGVLTIIFLAFFVLGLATGGLTALTSR